MEMLTDRELWQQVSLEPAYFTLNLIATAPTPARQLRCQVYGTILAIYLVHMKRFPAAISPAFTISLFQGLEGIVDLFSVQIYDPKHAAELTDFPTSSTAEVDQTMQLKLVEWLEVTVSDYAQ